MSFVSKFFFASALFCYENQNKRTVMEVIKLGTQIFAVALGSLTVDKNILNHGCKN
jgi:hypothetical protein